MNRHVIIAMLLLGAFLLGSGCITPVAAGDRFASNSTVYNFTRDLDASRNEPVNKTSPCTCMVCSDEKDARAKYVPAFLLSENYINFSLFSSTCNFVYCNQSSYERLFTEYINKGADNCDITNPVSGQKESRLCGPRFFMLGQGADANEYSKGQRYCAGQLKMPVIWAVANETGELTKNISANLMSCYLKKDQMPVVVWYSAGRSVNSQGYTKMLKDLNQTNRDPIVDGPIMVSTEALYQPYKADNTLDFARLDAVAAQILAIRKECPKCLSVLALKPTFEANNTQIPDMCALDYLLNDKLTNLRPAKCLARYGTDTARFNSRISGSIWEKVDVVGVGFMANENPNLTVCSPDTDVGRHMRYSREVLGQFYKPTVWYAVGIAAGPTATPYCEFREFEVGNSWETIIGNVPAFAGSGIIGIAPYRFSDDPDKAPLNLTVEVEWFNSSVSIDAIREQVKKNQNDPNKKPLFIYSTTSSDPAMQIGVAKYIPKMSGSDRAVFVGGDGSIYSARPNAGEVVISRMGGNYGFMNVDGTWHNVSAYLWFSNCEYYTRNRGPQWTSNTSIENIREGSQLESSDKLYGINVTTINSTSSEEILFYGDDGRSYAARKDGPGTKIYDRPIVEQATVQPLMFPTNGKSGAQCTMFETTKMYSRIGLRSNSEGGVFNLTPSRNSEDLRTVSVLSCGASGGCLFSTKMPIAFCDINATNTIFPRDACFEYPQIDEAIENQEANILAMRAIAVRESGLGRGDIDTISDPACQIGEGSNSTNCQAADKTPASLSAKANEYCSASDILYNFQSSPPNIYACGLGLMQCVDWPGAADECGGMKYNPFDPVDSACCGSGKFVSYTEMGKTKMAALLKNWDIARQVRAEESDWYASVLGAYMYYQGPGGVNSHMSELQLYSSSSGKSFAQHIVDVLGNDYGISWALRYNNALRKCDADCPRMRCPVSTTGTGPTEVDPEDDTLDKSYA